MIRALQDKLRESNIHPTYIEMSDALLTMNNDIDKCTALLYVKYSPSIYSHYDEERDPIWLKYNPHGVNTVLLRMRLEQVGIHHPALLDIDRMLCTFGGDGDKSLALFYIQRIFSMKGRICPDDKIIHALNTKPGYVQRVMLTIKLRNHGIEVQPLATHRVLASMNYNVERAFQFYKMRFGG